MNSVAAATDRRTSGIPLWALVVAPLALLALAIWGLYELLENTNIVRGTGFPPVEELSITRTVLRPGRIELHVVNGGPDEVTISQVQVDEAYWNFEFEPKKARGATLAHLQRGVVRVPYPWVTGEAHQVTLVSRNGVKFSSTIDVAVESPQPTWQFVVLFTLLGILVGVVPVFLGLIWYPVIQRLGSVAIDVLLCGTLGLLMFLAVDAAQEAIELVAKIPSVYGGAALFVMGTVGSVLVLAAISKWLQRNQRSQDERQLQLSLAFLIAVGIGLHNLAEGLAIGAAYNSGLIALGTALVIGFTIHNVTEGLAIVAPLARVRTQLNKLLLMGCIAGAPTILGAYIGGFTYSTLWALVFLAVGAGAIIQVVYQISSQMAGGKPILRLFTLLPNLAGLVLGFMIMYATKLFVAI